MAGEVLFFMDLLPGCRRGAVPVPIFSGEAEKTDGGPGKEEIEKKGTGNTAAV
jgi:hypothetical protein